MRSNLKTKLVYNAEHFKKKSDRYYELFADAEAGSELEDYYSKQANSWHRKYLESRREETPYVATKHVWVDLEPSAQTIHNIINAPYSKNHPKLISNNLPEFLKPSNPSKKNTNFRKQWKIDEK